ncbi:hypothetical protein PPYR_11878 [Photinus pyralis]|uniref:Uncharacterized protein n=1 Tax=Photinus pyralis TaxID=7054 RepID=A0A5N3ZZA7_PHOPY|nr:uncharacterized protein LOC116175311 [Photinus pyralis]XP_031358618.1 uncharacterized protein LOC116182239 [Photinus pyralis]KAB0790358.1 hypothetical protein PPYR_15273 [Photinus pyralis]KAB0795039.1 hypothetical protein PPYR_11878 [Photinus pyralis]
MKTLLILVVCMLGFSGIECMCILNTLDADEKACADPLNLDGDAILNFYQTNSDSPIFADYINCIFPKWNFAASDGTILFDNIIASDDLPWFIARMCQDVVNLIIKEREEYRKSAIYCKKHPPVIVTAATVRKCIADNYKPAQ